MSWTKPIDDPKTWLDKPAVRPPNKKKEMALELCKTYTGRKVAEMLGVDKSTISKWKREAEKADDRRTRRT